ncbi:MAG: 1-deoxy-D-xylulose-5-phosphate reductoisomerase [bacterium]|jgi:1-deoxy-D-xylulose-5-phosphate reductoisomerase
MTSSKSGITILGSTGSIGESSLDVVRLNSDQFKIIGLTCYNNIQKIADQILEFHPEIVSVAEGKVNQLKEILGSQASTVKIVEGLEGNLEVARYEGASKVIAAIVGAAGLLPVVESIKAKKDIALANKEPLVLAGSLVMELAKKHGVKILPTDSEHNAIYQALAGSRIEDVKFITLTASGGPFRTWNYQDFSKITVKDALKHPNWDMGSKITIDSATMMNKSLEVIEAKWLFDLEPEQIRVVVHPQSIIHSLVTYQDGSTLAQLGLPDMKVPIAYCMGHPARIPSGVGFLDLIQEKELTFEALDQEKFPTVQLAFEVLRLGGGAPAALNGANEELVALFLNEKIQFVQIFKILAQVVEQVKDFSNHSFQSAPLFLKEIKTIADAIDADEWGRKFVQKQIFGTTKEI